jgi:hypothetical protein
LLPSAFFPFLARLTQAHSQREPVRPDVTGGGMWWTVRPAGNLKPATYVYPLCSKHLPSMSEHMLIAPEGNTGARRHAHTACVVNTRKTGRLPTRDEWKASQPHKAGLFARLFGRK